MAFENKGALTATIVVAASDSLNKAAANLVCSGANDHIEIQEAIDALPATGGEVFLLDGTYNIEANLVMDSNQTLRGCGRNTILRTATDDVTLITATGASGSEKVGILIADLRIIGHLTAPDNFNGIHWQYVDHSRIMNVFSEDNYEDNGIYLDHCDWNTIIGNTCQNNESHGIRLTNSNNNIVTGNRCWNNGSHGIYIYNANDNVITENSCWDNGNGIYLNSSNNNTITGNSSWANISHAIEFDFSDNNTVTGNSFWANYMDGIYLNGSDSNVITGNVVLTSSQGADNTDDNIYLVNSDYNLIANNTCRAPTSGTTLTVGEPIAETEIAVTDTTGSEVGMGVVIDLGGANVEYHRISAITAGAPGVITIDAGLTNAQGAGETIDVPEARYGINISTDTCIKNIIESNDLHDAGKTANFNDAGTCTIVEDDNREIGVNQVKRYVYMKNTSAAQRVAGDVVIFKSAIAAGDEFTTTVTLGDDHVLGIVAETIAINAYGYVQVAGKTTVLKGSNDNGNIAIGDFLCASDTAVEAVLAGAGHTTFAIALEALAAAGPTALDALLINPMTF